MPTINDYDPILGGDLDGQDSLLIQQGDLITNSYKKLKIDEIYNWLETQKLTKYLPAGDNKTIQYNDNGLLGSVTPLIFDSVSGNIGINKSVPTVGLDVNSSWLLNFGTSTLPDANLQNNQGYIYQDALRGELRARWKNSTGTVIDKSLENNQNIIVVENVTDLLPLYNLSTFIAVSDNGSGNARITTSGTHTIKTGENVTITGSTGYNGTYTATYIDSTHFDLAVAFTSTDTGTYEGDWVTIATPTTISFKSASATTPISINKRFYINNFNSLRLTSDPVKLLNVLFTTTGDVFTADNLNFLSIDKLVFSAPNARIFNIKSSIGGAVYIDGLIVSGIRAWGYVEGANYFHFNSKLLNGGQGLVLHNNTSISLAHVFVEQWKNELNCVYISLTGTQNSFKYTSATGLTKSNEYFFYIDPQTVVTNPNFLLNILGGTMNANVFAPGSLTQKHPNFKAYGVQGLADSSVTLEANYNFVETPSIVPTVIDEVNQEVIAIKSGWTEDTGDTERFIFDTNTGNATYTGREDIKINTMTDLKIDPTNATYILGVLQYYLDPTTYTVTFDNTTDIIIENGTLLNNGDTITFFETTGVIPAGLRTDVIYYVINKTTNNFQISHTLGGSPVLFTTNGTAPVFYKKAKKSGTERTQSIQAGTPTVITSFAKMDIKTGGKIIKVVKNTQSSVDIEIHPGGYLRVN